MPITEIKVEIDAASAALADEILLELGSGNWSVLENVIARKAWLVGLGTEREPLAAEWAQLQAALGAAGVAVVSGPEQRELADADWRDSYKAHFHAWQFGRLHWVPVWERPTFQLPPGHSVLWLDPGLAFGTGNHETTRLCIERLVAIEAALPAGAAAQRRVIDAGCGSGILALSAALLGFTRIEGFDNDPEAVRVSEENAALNGLTGRVEFAAADLVSGLAGRQADILLANIQADVLTRFAAELIGAVAPGGSLILSGILAGENEAVRSVFARLAPGWAVEARVLGEWSDVWLRRP